MKLIGLLATIILLSFSFTTYADDFDNEFNGMNSTMDELDMETGSCIPEMRAQTERATKMLAVLKKKKSKIAKLEGKVDNLTAKLIARSEVKACDTSNLTQQIASLQTSNALLKSENGRLTSSVLTLQNAQTNSSGNQTALLLAQRENSELKLQVAKLKSELILGGGKVPPVVVRPVISDIDAEVVDADWKWTADSFKNRLGQDFAYTCPPKGAIHTVYGTDKYHVKSSVCTAAVHAGLITAKTGGTAIIRIINNNRKYKDSYRNDIGTKWAHPAKGFIFLK